MPNSQHKDVLPVSTREGVFLAHYSANGLAALQFPDEHSSFPEVDGSTPPETKDWHSLTVKALSAALDGKPPSRLPPLDCSAGTVFQQQVWTILGKIGPGEVMTYSQVAKAIGKPNAARAVGSACGANPIPVFIPCHRVLAANGGLGGFSGGLQWKNKLLQAEGVLAATRGLR